MNMLLRPKKPQNQKQMHMTLHCHFKGLLSIPLYEVINIAFSLFPVVWIISSFSRFKQLHDEHPYSWIFAHVINDFPGSASQMWNRWIHGFSKILFFEITFNQSILCWELPISSGHACPFYCDYCCSRLSRWFLFNILVVSVLTATPFSSLPVSSTCASFWGQLQHWSLAIAFRAKNSQLVEMWSGWSFLHWAPGYCWSEPLEYPFWVWWVCAGSESVFLSTLEERQVLPLQSHQVSQFLRRPGNAE